ncbi:hypothetical protein MTO96_027528 [Rhipicephalus appendiculatus]
MAPNLYDTLGIQQTATPDEVRKAFHVMAHRFHPDKNRSSEAAELFIQARKAFLTLSDEEARKAYDASLQKSWDEVGNSQSTRSTSSAKDASSEDSEDKSTPKIPKDPPLYKDVALSLEEVARGSIKKFKVWRKIEKDDGSLEDEVRMLTLAIKPGVLSGTEFRFQEARDKRRGRVAGDIIFVVTDQPHLVFKRSGIDLSAVLEISPAEAKKGSTVKIPTPCGGHLVHELAKDVKTGDVIKLTGRGLPSTSDSGLKGDMILSFWVGYDFTYY